ncbi:MAG: leucine-rich repeat protein [Clostridia bacterium]|nr:leucine-rich repeat protein [Clostridia bacterium]
MKKLLFSLIVFILTVFAAMPLISAEEFTSGGSYPTKLVYDEATKTMTITYAGSEGWYELMPISDPDENGNRSYDIQNFIDKYRTEVEHIEIGRFGKIQLIEVRDKSGNVTDEAKLFYGMTALKSVHFAASQRILIGGDKYGLFEGCTNLTSVWFGSDSNKIEGCANFTGCNTKDNDNGKGLNNFAKNLFKGCSSLKSVIYTKNSNEYVIYSSTFEGCTSLEGIKIGDNITNVSKEAFESYKFIDLESGADITTPLPVPDEEAPSDGGETDPDTGSSGGATAKDATISGHSTGEYNKKIIIDTYWAYYDDTKTLEFTSLTTSYNETGTISNCDDINWKDYKDVIEHIIVGNNIAKITVDAFNSYPALKDVRLGKQVKQIDPRAFENCPNLTTIWRDGKERIEGRADFRGLTRFMDCMIGTSITEVIMPENPNTLEISMPMTVKNVYSTNITEELKEHAKLNLYNLINLNDPNEKYEYYVYIDPTLPYCGSRAVFGFDEATGTLTVYGAGAIDDIVNYHGGGSKNQPWFSIKKQIKHVVITEHITTIGKYAFTECEALETVQLPNVESIIINAAAFEGCFNMKSVYIEGSEPIEGTIDVRNVQALESWTFAYNYLIANAVINPSVEIIGNSVFSDNTNLANIYGTPGSFAEEYAAKIGGTFYDISSSAPQPIKCEPPESSIEETTQATPEETEPQTTNEPETTAEAESETVNKNIVFVKSDIADQEEKNAPSPVPFIVIAAAAVIIIAVAIFIVIKRKNSKNTGNA